MGEKIKTEIICSRYPMYVLESLNERKQKKLGRDLKENEKWNALLIIGPFESSQIAKEFHDEWKFRTRGVESRVKRGTLLAARRNMPVYVGSSKEETEKIKKIWKNARSSCIKN